MSVFNFTWLFVGPRGSSLQITDLSLCEAMPVPAITSTHSAGLSSASLNQRQNFYTDLLHKTQDALK